MARSVIAHTTDLSGDDGAAFVHAAALAAASGARLVTIHGNAPPEVASRLPAAAPLAARWSRSIDHERRCHECCDDVTDTVLDALNRLEPELVIVGHHDRHGLRGFLHESVSEALARNLDVPTLVVPNKGRGFVDETSGAIDLALVVVPAGDAAAADTATRAAWRLAAIAGIAPSDITMRVGRDVAEAARDERPCLIVVTDTGHHGVLDALFGSHAEHVLHASACPVLVVPRPRSSTAP